MGLQNFKDWAAAWFAYPIPGEYLDFLEKGDFDTTVRKYYVTGEGNILELSEWFASDDLPEVYENCRKEKMIEEYHLPILDSCGCIAVLNCSRETGAYGQMFLQTSLGEYEEETGENIYERPEFIAGSFLDFLSGLHDAEELEEQGF